MTKLKVLDLQGNESSSIEMPIQFEEDYRPNLIKRAFYELVSRLRQKYGAFPEAGKRPSSKLSKRRSNYRGSYGHSLSRVQRKVFWRRGTQFGWQAAFSPGIVGGRRAHPPKAEKNWELKINKKEKKKALRSALSAVLLKDVVQARGHNIPEKYPFVIYNSFENLNKTKEVENVLVKLGFEKEFERAKIKTIRAGRGKARGRPYKKRKGLLIVVSNDTKIRKAAENLPGIDVCKANALNAQLLAPGSHAGRATLFTKAAIEEIAKSKLYL